MKNFRRKFFKLIGYSCLSLFLLPYKKLYSASKNIINPNLTEEQKKFCLMNLLKDHFLVL